jgi:hypothetical protein
MHKPAEIILCRSAFIHFNVKGVADMRYEFAEPVKFVKEQKEFSIEVVTVLQTKKLIPVTNNMVKV